jgi:hypothetical protein
MDELEERPESMRVRKLKEMLEELNQMVDAEESTETPDAEPAAESPLVEAV